MEWKTNVMKGWGEQCMNQCEYVRVCKQIREMCSYRDRHNMTLYNKEEGSTIIECFCTGYII